MTNKSIKIFNPDIILMLTREFSVSVSTVYDALREARSYGHAPLIRKRAVELAIIDHKEQIKKLRKIKV